MSCISMLTPRLLKLLLSLFVFFAIGSWAKAQSIAIYAQETPLNQVFKQLGETYRLPFSFNDELLAQYVYSDSSTYQSPKVAITAMTKGTPLAYKKVNGVFVVFQKDMVKKTPISTKKEYLFHFYLLDIRSGEPLPYSTIYVNSTGVTANSQGHFSFKSQDSIVYFQASHVGYESIQTTFTYQKEKPQPVGLLPTNLALAPITVSASKIYPTPLKYRTGLTKINHQLATLLPGNKDNTVFNLLRLQPGVLAAGEQAKDYSIWGSSNGQTLILFDGITLFNTSAYNDHIGVINPLLVQDIEVWKGGYQLPFGSRVGGVVNITGKTGNPSQFETRLSINNLTANGMLNLPIAKKYALLVAFRQTYYNWINGGNFIDKKVAKATQKMDNNFRFRDVNLKLTKRRDNGDHFYVSTFQNRDFFAEEFQEEEKDIRYTKDEENLNKQAGVALFYGKKWATIGTTNSTLAYSQLQSRLVETQRVFLGQAFAEVDKEFGFYQANRVSELSVKVNHVFPAVKRHHPQIGVGWIRNGVAFEDAILTKTGKKRSLSNRYYLWGKDNLSISKKITLEVGLRSDYYPLTQQTYWQPRLKAILAPSTKWTLHFAWGKYHQFLSQNTLVNEGNFQYIWQIAEREGIPVIGSQHYVAGIRHTHRDAIFNLDFFYKKTNDLSRFGITEQQKQFTATGRSKNYGVDVLWQQKIQQHRFWLGYTWSRHLEHFSNFSNATFHPAPNDQRHELKGAAIFNLQSWTFSMNYVYGSGIANTIASNRTVSPIPYSRLDVAFQYQFQLKKAQIEAGLSVLNLLKAKNVLYNNFAAFSADKIEYSAA
ncbi:MAG: TonB-dependent receptor, partial [Bacteroidota bacterium]